MKRLTSDNTFEMNMTELALNQVFVRNGWAWYRKSPEDACSVCDLIRSAASKGLWQENIEFDPNWTDEELGEIMLDWLQFGEEEPEGVLAILYRALWAMAEVRERLRLYEDAMPLERAQELAKAEKDGRLVVLPCKVGDLPYEIDLPEYGVITCQVSEIHPYFGPLGHVKGNPMVSTAIVSVEVVDGHGKESGYTFETPDLGGKRLSDPRRSRDGTEKEGGRQ